MESTRFRILATLTIFSFLLNFVTLSKVNSPQSTQTTVYKTAQPIPGPMGLSGATGREGLSIVGPSGATTYVPQPIIVQGQPAKPCSVTQNENGDTIITCPDGSTVVIPKAQDGEDGVNGSNGSSAPSIAFRKNQSTGNVEYQYEGDDSWLVLLKKCEYQGTC